VLAWTLRAVAILGGLAGLGGGVLIVVFILALALIALFPLWWLSVDESADGPEGEARQLLNSL
jgi:hypothetical protein